MIASTLKRMFTYPCDLPRRFTTNLCSSGLRYFGPTSILLDYSKFLSVQNSLVNLIRLEQQIKLPKTSEDVLNTIKQQQQHLNVENFMKCNKILKCNRS